LSQLESYALSLGGIGSFADFFSFVIGNFAAAIQLEKKQCRSDGKSKGNHQQIIETVEFDPDEGKGKNHDKARQDPGKKFICKIVPVDTPESKSNGYNSVDVPEGESNGNDSNEDKECGTN
jgi:hypothetical protein